MPSCAATVGWLSRRRRGRRGAGGRPSLHAPHGALSPLAGVYRRLGDLGCLLPFGSDEDTGSAPAPLGVDPPLLVQRPPSGTRSLDEDNHGNERHENTAHERDRWPTRAGNEKPQGRVTDSAERPTDPGASLSGLLPLRSR